MSDEPTAVSRHRRLLALQERAFDEWMARVRVQVSRAQDLAMPILVDTLPVLYQHLAAVASGLESAYDRSTLSSEHGGERARLTALDAQSVAHELHLFRNTVLEVWQAEQIPVSAAEKEQVNDAIDVAIRDAITGFVLVQAAFREQFFAALTHDLRTPLSTASMAAELIAQTDDLERIRTLASMISKQHGLMEQMVDDLLDTMVLQAESRKTLHFSTVELRALSESVVESAVLCSRRNIVLSGEPVEGNWCEPALRRAMENLLNNAVKYSHPGSTIEVDITHCLDRVNWKVTNHGPPIPADQVEALFQLFRRADREKRRGVSGWGIGLPYVRSVAERHAGSIIVVSNDQKTSFAIDIPVDPRPILASARHVPPG